VKIGIGIPAGYRRLSSGLLVVDSAQSFTVEATLGALGVVDSEQEFSVTCSLTPSTGTLLTRYTSRLACWLRGDLVTLDGSNNVSSWLDKTANGRDHIQATPGSRPGYTLVNAAFDNNPTLNPDGVDDVLSCAGLTVNLASNDFYITFVMRQGAGWTTGDTFSGGSGSTVPRLTQITPSPNMRMSATSGGTANGGAPIGTVIRGRGCWSATAGKSYLQLGGTTVTFNPGTGTRTISSLFAAVAGGTPSLWWHGECAEFAYILDPAGSGGPSPAERAADDADWLLRYPSAVF
jgi:hypothetical protein